MCYSLVNNGYHLIISYHILWHIFYIFFYNLILKITLHPTIQITCYELYI